MISKFFIERPVLANVLAILMVVIGAVALMRLAVAQYPNVVPPTISVTTRYPGASARAVVDTVALPIEQQVNGVDGMIYMQSWSAADGSYTLIVTFKIGMDINFAQVLVQNRVSSALAQLPQAVQAQGVTVQQKSTAILQFVTLTSPDERYDSLFLANYATISLQPELARLPGVGQVNIFGAGQYSMRIWLDPNKLYARSLTTEDVVNALKGQNQQVTAGQLGMPPGPNTQAFQYTLDIAGRFDDVSQFENVVVKTEANGQMVHVRDVGRVELGAQTYSQIFTLNGKPAAGIGIFQTLEANALDVAGEVAKKMDQLAKSFPPGLVYSIPFDTTTFVRESIKEVWKTLFEAAILVLIVIVVFLQDWRAMLVPMTTVPVTIIGAFAAMAAFGFTINLSTLFAIVLAIGIVVDDAIVVVEGAAHHIERGLPAKEAAIQAMNELFGPIVGITLVLMSVFLPAAFIPGLTGKMFAQFALVIAATALLSAINAATLKPTQCALWLRPATPPSERNLFFRAFNAVYDPFERAYARLIGGMVARSSLMCVIALIVIGVAGYGLTRVATGFLPIEDQGYVLVTVQLPDGASLVRTKRVLDQVSEIAGKNPAVANVTAISGISKVDNNSTLANAGVAYVIFKDWSERGKGEDLRSLLQQFNREFAAIEQARIVVFPPPPIQGIGSAAGFAMQLELRDGSFDLTKLQTTTNTVIKDAQTGPGQGRDAASVDRRRVRDARRLSWIELRRPVQQIRPRLPGLCAGGFEVPPAPAGHRAASGSQQAGRHHPDWHHDSHHPDRRAVLAQPLQLLSVFDGDGAAGGGLQFRPGDDADGADRRQGLAPRHRVGMDRDVVPGKARRQPDLLHLRVRHAAGLFGAGRPVRELVHADRGAAGGAALGGGAGGSAQGAWPRQQPLHADRSRAADCALRQERDLDRGGSARAAHIRRQADHRGGAGGGARPLPSHPHDLFRLHPRSDAAGARHRRRRQFTQVDRHRGVQRYARLDLLGGAVRAVVFRRGSPFRGMARRAQSPGRGKGGPCRVKSDRVRGDTSHG